MRRPALALATSVTLAAPAGCGGGDAPPPAAGPQAPRPTAAASVRTLATGLRVPWGVAFLPGGDALVSERTTGRILRVPRDGGTPRAVMTVPGVATQLGEGGLLGLAVSPHYATDRLVYAYYTTAGDNRIARFRLGATPRPILTGLRNGAVHNGGRLAFGPDGKLYVGTGEAGDTGLAQDRGSLNGKILRLEPDGSVPADNPFRGSAVYSLGHRNVQGLAFDRAGRLWATEFGQNERDEINLIRPGRNYGWPVVEGVGSTQGGRFTNPQVTWATSEASPSGAAISGSTLYVGALVGQRLWRVPLRGAKAGRPTALLQDRFGRLRTVATAPDGTLWITTSNRDGRGAPRSGDDRIVRLRP
jgi:glucose/arabinose dehydrogenase